MVILLISGLLAAQPAAQAAPPAAPVPVAKPAKEKKVCRSAVPTGSMLPKTVCHTQEQWDDIDFANHNPAQLRRDLESTTDAPHSQ